MSGPDKTEDSRRGAERRKSERMDSVPDRDWEAEAHAAKEVLANYRALTDNSPTGIIIIQDGKVVYANPEILRLMGYTLKEALSADVWQVIHPDDRERVLDCYRRRMSGQDSPEQYEVRVITKSGKVRHLELRATVVQFNGAPAVLDNVVDITDRKRAEEAVAFRLEFERVVSSISASFISLPLDQIDTGIDHALRVLGGFAGVDRCAVHVFRNGMTWLDCRYEWCAEGIEPHVQILQGLPQSDHPWFAAELRKLEPVVIPSVDAMPEEGRLERQELQAQGVKSMVLVPMASQGRPVGVLVMGSVRARRSWSQDDVALFKLVGEIIVNALERKRAEEERRESEEKYRRLVEDVNDWVWEVDESIVYTYCSPRVRDILGYEPEEVVGRSPLDFMPPEEAERTSAALSPCSERGEPLPTFSNTLQRKDGRMVVVQISGSPILDDQGVFRGHRGVARDITDQVRVEERLRKLNECFLSFCPDPLANINRLTALAGELLGATAALYNRLEEGLLYSWGQWNTPSDYSPVDNPEGHICYDVIRRGGEDLTLVRNLLQTDYARTDPNVTAYGLQTYLGKAVKFGDTHVGSLCCVYQRDYVPDQEDSRLLGIIASAIGTEEGRRHAELALRRSERFLESVFDGIQDGISVLDTDLNILRFNRTVEEWFPHQLPMAGRKCYEVYHCRSEPCEVCPTARAIEQKALQSDVVLATRAEGRDAWVELFAYPLLDENGDVWGVVEHARDITERKRAEDALRESEERYRRLVELSPDGIGVTVRGRSVFVNAAWLAIHGASKPEDIIGKPTLDFISPEHREIAQARMASMIKGSAESVPRMEEKFLRLDGTSFDVEVAATRITYEGEPAILAIIRDITERKRAEEQRIVLERQLEAQKRQFYRDTILSVTDGKLDICEPREANAYVARAQLKIGVRSPAEVSGARHEVERFCGGLGVSGERLERFMIGVGEAIANAVKHANGGRVYAGRIDDSVWVGVADRGPGISSLILPKATLLRGFSTKPSLGLGYTIMLDVADRILLKTGERGTTVILVQAVEKTVVEIGPAQLPDTWNAASP